MEISKQAFALRKNGGLDGALKAAIEAMKSDPHEEWKQRAMAWVLHDLIKPCSTEGELDAKLLFFIQELS